MTKTLQAFTIGNAVVDTFLVSTTFNPYNLQQNFKQHISQQFQAIGGGALNAASAFSKLGFKAYPICPIGNDHQAEFIIKQAKSKNIDTTCLTKKKTHSHQSTIISMEKQEEPLVFSYKNKELSLDAADIPAAKLKNCNLLYLSSFEASNIPAIHAALSATPQECTVALNANPHLIEQKLSQLELIFEKADIIFMNQHEAELYMKTKHEPWNLHKFFALLNPKETKTIILTLGRNGAHISHQGKIYSHPSLNTLPTNTLGAGDTFNATLSALIVQEQDIKTAFMSALYNSSSVITHHDSQTGMLSQKELLNKIVSFDQLSIRPTRSSLSM